MIIRGDSLEVLKTLEANSVDAVVTDPPWALKFMNKKWDYSLPSKELWAEVIRVLKPGGHALVCCGTRTQHRMVVNVEDAGFEIRDVVSHIYGSGFPKSHNMPGGLGTALKPACEFWTLTRKPLSESTVAKNVLRWGTGALNIDGSRITGDKGISGQRAMQLKGEESKSFAKSEQGAHAWTKSLKDRPEVLEQRYTQGRWPANVLFDEEAAAMLDEQSGLLRMSKPFKKISSHNFDVAGKNTGQKYESQKGLAFKAHASKFFYVAKASKRERNAGLEGMPEVRTKAYEGGDIASAKTPDSPGGKRTSANHHPTVKPIKLMEYLCKLVTPHGGIILDPFCGSGSTGVAATRLGFKFIGIEREKEYVEIAEKRIANAIVDEQLEL